jgi:mono/diheme cytochrome c family protein
MRRATPADLLLLAVLCASLHRPGWAQSVTLLPDLPLLREGYRRYHGVCAHCHGPDGLGSSFAPGLIEPLLSRERFADAVLDGASGPRGVMRGFSGDRNVEPYLDSLYAYISARASGRLGRGRLGKERAPACADRPACAAGKTGLEPGQLSP